MAPPSAGQLSRQAAEGPIVYLYTSRWNHGALILRAGEREPIRYVPLPLMTEDQAYTQINRLRQACSTATGPDPASQRQQAQRELHEVLTWMWDAIAAPILDVLGLHDTPGPGQPWPRIWWCPIGALAFLPLQAAGHHLHPEPGRAARTVMDRAISSYTATVRALSYARNRLPTASAATTSSVLVVAVADLPSIRPLPGVIREAALLQRLIPNVQRLDGASATLAAVIAALDSCQVAHFACHGVSDWQYTAASRLLIYDDAASR